MLMYDVPNTDITDIEIAVRTMYIMNRGYAIQHHKDRAARCYYTQKALKYYRLYRIIKDCGYMHIKPFCITDETIIKDSNLTPFEF